ncbi:hypothetical protein HY993_03075 [Candidatus Micrarchaeota archaeon]|nr:hypothetical protein [Candidatus Micrarchaeota archaeon]
MPKIPSWRKTKGKPNAMRALVNELAKVSEARLNASSKMEDRRLAWKTQRLKEHAVGVHGFDWEKIHEQAVLAKAGVEGKPGSITPESRKARIESRIGLLLAKLSAERTGNERNPQAKKELPVLLRHARENGMDVSGINWPNEYEPFAARKYVWKNG